MVKPIVNYESLIRIGDHVIHRLNRSFMIDDFRLA
jgi:hypothetical protein